LKKSEKKRPPQRPAAIKLRPTEDGLHLDGSILWFDSHANGDLSFLSSAALPYKSKVPQVITTEETVKILETKQKRPNALVCQYNRPFSIGRLRMELLPSGSVLGGASLYVETDKGRLLYAPCVQTQKIPTVRQLQLKKAQTLILGAFHPDPNSALPNRRKEKERLLMTIKSHLEAGRFPSVLCQPVAIAQELTQMLTEERIPVAVHNSIYRVNRVYETYGCPLGDYSLYDPRRTKHRVLLLPVHAQGRSKLRNNLPDGPLLVVDDTIKPFEEVGALGKTQMERFYLSATCDGRELREVISAVNPKEIYIFGPYAKRYCEELKSYAPQVTPLFSNDQPTLF